MLIAYLSSRDELERTKSALQVGGVGLEVVEGSSNAGLELRWLRTGRAVRRDLVEGTHVCWCCREVEDRIVRKKRFKRFVCVSRTALVKGPSLGQSEQGPSIKFTP